MSGVPVFATGFVGRSEECAELRRLAAGSRLVTVLGPGGVGKTRLTAKVADGWGQRFAGGIWWFDLATVQEPEMVARMVADEVGVRSPGTDPVGGIATVLAGRGALLVLDNCEHLAAACAGLVSGLLAACPPVRIVATSREPLAIAGETVYPVPPLAPQDALRLFVQRARARQPGFEAAGQTRADVAVLCGRLDHLPLAIELASARVAMMSPREVLERLDRRFELLTSPARDVAERHRTMLATVEWSYRLLDAADQRLLDVLAVFAGSFGLAAAEALAGETALAGLGRLIDRSMVVAVPAPLASRYRLLETIREHGLRRLAEAGRMEEAADRSLGYFLGLVEAAYAERMTTGSDRLLLMFSEDLENLRGALEHAWRRDAGSGLRLAGAMREQWVRRSPVEGRVWLERFVPGYRHRDRYLGRALLAVGHIAMVQQANPEAARAFGQSRDVCAEAGDAAGEAWAVFFLGLAEALGGGEAAARPHLDRALELHSAVPSPYGVLQARATIGQLMVIGGSGLEDGRRLLQDVLATAKELGNRWSVGHAHAFLGLLELQLGNLAEAGRHFEAAAGEFAGVDDQVMLAAVFCGLARAGARTNARRALALAGAAAGIRERIGGRFPVVWSGLLQEARAEAASALGPAAASEAWRRGQRLGAAEAAELARGGTLAARPPGGLSRRELEVAGLIAEGLSNRAAARRLYLSERTVEGHVQHILTKLGLSNRTEVAAWLREQPPG